MSGESTWHYTDNTGSQAGPVPISELQKLIHDGRIPTSAIAWTEGMTDWQPISQIEALQAAPQGAPLPTAIANPAPAATPTTQTVNPYATPTAQPARSADFDLNPALEYGGIRRLNYFLKNLMLIVVLIAVGIFGVRTQSEPSLIIILIGLVLFFVFYIRFMIQRIRNIGLSAWWLLLIIVPLVSNLLGIALLSLPEGFAQHKKIDTIGIVVAVITGGLALLSFALNIASIFAAL